MVSLVAAGRERHAALIELMRAHRTSRHSSRR